MAPKSSDNASSVAHQNKIIWKSQIRSKISVLSLRHIIKVTNDETTTIVIIIDCKQLQVCTSVIDDFRGACAVKRNVQVAGRTSSVSTTEMLSTHDVTLRNVDGSLFHVQI